MGLALALMYERSLGAASRRAHEPAARSSVLAAAAAACAAAHAARRASARRRRWAPYLATLPAREPLPVTWPPAALRALHGTQLPEAVASDRKRLRADWEAHVRPLSAAQPERFPPAAFSHDAYVAARTLTASRGFAVDAYHGEGMVPFADLFNHEADEHVHFTARRALRRPCAAWSCALTGMCVRACGRARACAGRGGGVRVLRAARGGGGRGGGGGRSGGGGGGGGERGGRRCRW